MKKDRKIKNTIYSDWWLFDLVDDDQYKEDMRWQYSMEDEDYETADWFDFAYRTLEEDLEAEQCNLDVDVGNTIIAIGDMGLWNGRVKGYKEIKGNRISDCLIREEELCEWWCDAHDFRAKMAHHDGTNYILYRRRKDGITDYQWDNFLYKLYMGTANKEHISKYTTSLLPYVAKVYGWNYRKYGKAAS